MDLINQPLLILNFDIQNSSFSCMLQHLALQFKRSNKQEIILFANTNFILQNQPLSIIIREKKFLILNDGIGLDIGSLLLYGYKFKENLNGTDFTEALLKELPANQKIYLLGSKDSTLQNAKKYIESSLNGVVVGYTNGFDNPDSPTVIDNINRSQATILLVAMGNPKQELWIINNHLKLRPILIMGVGALFEFWGGEKLRAPQWIRMLHFEWLYRLSIEPKRLLRRYSIDIIYFIWLCFCERIKSVFF